MKEEKGRVGKGRKGGWEKREKKETEREEEGRGEQEGEWRQRKTGRNKDQVNHATTYSSPPRLGYSGSDVRGQKSVRGRKPGFGVTRM